MTVYTFPLTVAVPPIAVFGVGPTFNADTLGTDATPAGWPENGRARSVSVTISAVDEVATGDVIVGIADTGTGFPVTGSSSATSGTWSGAAGTVADYETFACDAYELDAFSSWQTDYLTNPGSSGNVVTIAADAAHDGASVDGRATIRRTDWDSLWDGSRERQIAIRRDGSTTVWSVVWQKISEFSTPYIQATYVKGDGNAYIVQAYITDLGLTDGNLQELRWQMDSSGITLSGPAGAATPFATFGTPGTLRSSTAATIRLLSNATSNTGLDGDMSAFTLRIGGTLVADLDLAAMTASTTSSWTNNYADTVTRTSSSAPAAVGQVTGTVTALCTFDARYEQTTWRLFVDTGLVDVTVDEVVVDVSDIGWVRGRVWGAA